MENSGWARAYFAVLVLSLVLIPFTALTTVLSFQIMAGTVLAMGPICLPDLTIQYCRFGCWGIYGVSAGSLALIAGCWRWRHRLPAVAISCLVATGCMFFLVTGLKAAVLPFQWWSYGFDLAAVGKRAPRDILRVRTVEELEKCERVRVAEDWEVRLGLGDAGADAAPWKLLYCHANYLGLSKEPSVEFRGRAPGQLLGPAFWTLEKFDERKPEVALAPRAAPIPREGCFCASILTAWEGPFILRVFDIDGRLVAYTHVPVEKVAPCAWQQFVEERKRVWVPRRKAFAAYPTFGPTISIWPLEGDSVVRWGTLEKGTPLPGRLPVEYPWSFVFGGERSHTSESSQQVQPLKLSIEKGAFVVRSEAKMLDWPDYHLLARWWVDGKPVSAERTDEVEMVQLGRLVAYTKEMRIAVGWPDSLGALKAGDQVGLQVLYSPAMFRQLPKSWPGAQLLTASASSEPDAATVPLLSNRIEFAVTQALIDARQETSSEP